jgi:hypothetical protein
MAETGSDANAPSVAHARLEEAALNALLDESQRLLARTPPQRPLIGAAR